MLKNAGTVPGPSTSKISNNHSTIINPSLAIPACQRAPESGKKRGDCPWYLKRILGHLPPYYASLHHSPSKATSHASHASHDALGLDVPMLNFV